MAMLLNEPCSCESKVCAGGVLSRLPQSPVQFWFEIGDSDVLRRPDVQQLMQRTAPVIGHQNLHLPLGEILDVFVESACLAVFTLNRAIRRPVFLIAKQPASIHRDTSPLNGGFRIDTNKVP